MTMSSPLNVVTPEHFRVVISFRDDTSKLYLVCAASQEAAVAHVVDDLHPDDGRILSVEHVQSTSRRYEVVA